MTYNEEQNIGRLLESILKQKLKHALISEIVIISSGSTDKTNRIIKKFINQYPFISLVKQKKRLGKASAVNLFLSLAKEDIVILSSGDILLKEKTIDIMIAHFKKAHVGIVGSHPIPLNDPKTYFGFAAHLLWDLHHEISIKTPKMGEFIAFRKVFKKIPVISSVDETNIEALVKGQGYQVMYAANAIVYNKGAENLKDFINRRRHIYAGHLTTKYDYGYEVSTVNGLKIFFILLHNVELSWRFIIWTPGIISLEIASRFLGMLDYKFKLRTHTVWEVTPSTKQLYAKK